MDYYQLHCFRVTAEYQSITRAAAELYISQPSLTQTIHRLEKDLGYHLFDRSHKKITLNASGRILYERACRIEQLLADTRTELDEFNKVRKPTVDLHIGCASMLLPKLLLYLKNSYPGIEFRVYQWNFSRENAEAGLWLIMDPISPQDSVLLEESISLALPADHPLAEKDSIRLEDLPDQNFLCLTEQWSLTQLVERECGRHSFHPHTVMQFDNPVLMREVLLCKMGMAFIPSVTWKLPAQSGLVMRNVEDFAADRRIYLHVPERYRTAEEKICVEGIRSFFSALLN